MKTEFRIHRVAWSRQGRQLLLAAAFSSCAVTGTAPAAGQEAARPVDPAAHRNVQIVAQDSTSADGQMSWIIQPDVRRTPQVAGLNGQLPPHVERRMNYAFDLAQRGAVYSAAIEFQAVLGLCALELDTRDGGTHHREALRQALIALDEADQFGGDQVDWRESADVRQVAAGHHTPVLRQQQAVAIDSIQAVQAYYAFAEERMTYACGGFPGASLALYGMGRTIAVPGTHVAHAAGKAALYHRVALAVGPQNTLAANELGVLLAQHGQLTDAQRILQQCVAIQPSSQTYRNLAVVYARQGDQSASRMAMAASESLAASEQAATASYHALPNANGEGSDGDGRESEKKSGFLTKFPSLPKSLPNPFRR